MSKKEEKISEAEDKKLTEEELDEVSGGVGITSDKVESSIPDGDRFKPTMVIG